MLAKLKQKNIQKFINKNTLDFYSTLYGLKLSSIGIGMYKGMKNPQGDKYWEESLNYALLKGVNVIDNAIRYRGQMSEKLLGKVISYLIKNKKISRKEIFITSKGGLIGTPSNLDDKSYVKKYLIDTLQIKKRKSIKSSLYLIKV